MNPFIRVFQSQEMQEEPVWAADGVCGEDRRRATTSPSPSSSSGWPPATFGKCLSNHLLRPVLLYRHENQVGLFFFFKSDIVNDDLLIQFSAKPFPKVEL